MDCGPAALHCLLQGFGISSSYGRLREACQTDIDGTSIDTLEVAANQLGLEAEQIVVPAEHALLSEMSALPAITITRLATGATHFVVLWRKWGRTVQVMDPAVGRRWMDERQLRADLYIHKAVVPAADWLEFASSDDFQKALRIRMGQVGIRDGARLQQALATGEWRPLATLDAGVRLTQKLVAAGAVRKGKQACRTLEKFLAAPSLIPNQVWSATADPDGADHQVLVRGVVLVRASGRSGKASDHQPDASLNPELAAVRGERSVHPLLAIAKYLRGAGRLRAGLLLLTPVIISLGLLVEALLFRGLFDIASQLGLAGQRFSAFAALILFSLLVLALECAAFAGGARLSRLLENQLRVAFLEKLPKLSDRYFQSRLMSDMAERCHAVHRLRHMPDLLRQLLQATCELAATALGVYWLEPVSGPFVLAIVISILVPACFSQRLLAERDLRMRTQAGGLTRFYLDAMAGLTAIRAHGAETTILRQHERLVKDWATAALRLQGTVVAIEALQSLLVLGLVASLLIEHPLQGVEIGRVLLVAYWALNLPLIGQNIAMVARQIPNYKNITGRLLEPLGAPEEQPSRPMQVPEQAPAIEFREVRAQASGHTILDGVNVRIEGGSHVAIVGQSGAGKSSLAGVLLGWLKASEGAVLIDGLPLQVEALRPVTAWVDPAVQIWNQSLYSNLQYGRREDDAAAVGGAVDLAMLRTVLESLPAGLQTELGEGGACVSGGEGQRVRLARGLLRSDAKLVILDEPFRGLDREKRRELLARARSHWKTATLLCITHDLAETEAFDRVLVMEGGRVIEDASPQELLSSAESRYCELLETERQAREEVWGAPFWRRIHLHGGRLMEESRGRDTVLTTEEVA